MRGTLAIGSLVAAVALVTAGPAQAADPDPGYPFALAFSGPGSGEVRAAADFDGDGNQDLLLSRAGSGFDAQLEIRLGNGDGSFGQPTDVADGAYSAAQIADFNGDDAPDIVGSVKVDRTTVRVGVLLNDGHGNLEESSTRTFSNWSTRSFALADLNGDGRDEVALVGASIAVMGVDEDGDLSEPALQPVHYPPPSISEPYEGEPGLRDLVAAGDFNGDAYDDLAIEFTVYNTTGGSGPLDVLDGSPSGALTQHWTGATDVRSQALGAADITGDGLDDVVATAYSIGGDTHASIIGFLNQPDGTMERHNYGDGNGYSNPAFGDFDGNGTTDILAGSRFGDPGIVAVLGPVGEAGLVVREYPETGATSAVVVGDFNNDGLDDAAASGSSGLKVELNINAGEPPLDLRVGKVFQPLRLDTLDSAGLQVALGCRLACQVSATLRTKSPEAASHGLGGTLMSTVQGAVTKKTRVTVGNHSEAMGKVLRNYDGRPFKARLKVVATPIWGPSPKETVVRKLRLRRAPRH